MQNSISNIIRFGIPFKNNTKCQIISINTFITTSKEKDKFGMPARFVGPKESVWTEYAQLAAKHKPLNLGLGFPDFAGAPCFTQALADVAKDPDPMLHQYTNSNGHPRLVKALATLYSKILCRKMDPENEFIVTIGGYEALFIALQGHLNKGDEAILIEPFFNSYEPVVKAACAICKFTSVKLKPQKDCPKQTPSWALDCGELRRLFNKKTKLIILNNPQNPTGKVFTMEELLFIASLCKQWNVLCISDEVYEWMVYKPRKHIRMATLPGMWDRTITIGSAGKSYYLTGWKIGWAYGPSKLLENLRVIHENAVDKCATPLQEAMARAIEKEIDIFDTDKSFYRELSTQLEIKRDFIYESFEAAGLKPIKPEGTFFILSDVSTIARKMKLSSEKDKLLNYRVSKWMIKNIGLQGIPASAFYGKKHKKLGQNYIRYCFAKKDENLKKACEIIQTFSKTLK